MATQALAMIPKRPTSPTGYRKREKGKSRRVISMRVDGDVRDWIEQAESAGLTATFAVLRALRIAILASKALGDDWWEVERRANLEGLDAGELLGRLAKAALDAERTTKGRK